MLGAMILSLAGCATSVKAVSFDAPSDNAPSYEGSPIADALLAADAAVQKIVDVPAGQRTFQNTLGALDDLSATLNDDTIWTQFMAYVSTDADERAAGTKAEEDVTNWNISLMKRADLFHAVSDYAETKPKLSGEQARMLEHALRDFRRAGMALAAEQREELKRIQMEINKLGIEFEKNIREDETVVPLTRDELTGMSDEFIAGLHHTGDLYLATMDYPTFVPIQDLCDNETTREKVWVAYKRRGGQANVDLLERLLELRAQASTMLGYDSTADYETEIRMAHNAKTVREFYAKLRPLVRKKALLDKQEYLAAKREHTSNPDAKLYPWDSSFYQKYLMRTKYAVDSEKVREYFPIERVIDGLFSITQSLYGLEYRDVTAIAGSEGRPIWHEDVKVYEVIDKQSGKKIGTFYLDLFPRANKYSHAAQWGLFNRKVWPDGHVTLPVAALVCNFTKPTRDKPSLMAHSEVETFFHEFGHCLHTIMSEAHYAEFSGTAVARDFVEAPSQMFQNWVWNADVLKSFTGHYKTGEPLPDEMLDGMIRARNLGSGMLAEHQFYYGLVDLAYHTAPRGEIDTTKVGIDMLGEVELYDGVPETRFQASFGHLVGYQAGYYGYMWSLVYAQDMFQRFRELGLLNPRAGMYYRNKILKRGGTIDEIDMLRDYLGREPKMDAFLEHLGLKP